MVNLTRIYTRTGDDGSTALGDLSRTRKTDPRLAAYADANEANAAIGVALAVGDLPAKEITDCGEANMGMGKNIKVGRGIRSYLHWTCVVHKDEWADHAAKTEGKYAADFHSRGNGCLAGGDDDIEHRGGYGEC